MVPLSSIESGAVGVVQDLNGGRVFISRVAALGFTPGTEITMLQNYRRGPLIVVVRDTHVALGRGEARKILVGRTEQ
jgi:ferrous iron transport protein A